MAVISLFRTSDLNQSEQKWLKSQLDTRLGLTLGVDVTFSSTSHEALQASVIVALGGGARAVLLGVTPQSDASSRGLIEGFADRAIVTTWGLAEPIKDPSMNKEFLVDMLKARVYAFGLGNKSSGYVSAVQVAGSSVVDFSVDKFDQYVAAFGAAL